MKITLAFLTLILTMTAIQLQAGPQEFNYTMVNLQRYFDQQICGGCQGSILGRQLCKQHRNHLQNLTNIDIGPRSIIDNQLGIDLVKILIKTTTGDYTINGRNYTGIQTAYLTAMPILKNNSQYRGHIAYYHPTIFNKQLVPSNLDANPQKAGKSYLALIAYWCSLGFSVTFYDGNGLGINYKLIHPYVLLPEVNVQNMYYCLNDTLRDLQDQYYAKNRDAIIKLYAVGYSQGGAYALWHQYCYALRARCPGVTGWINYKYQMERVSGLQGAYDPKGTVIPFLLANVTTKPNTYNIQSEQLTTFAKPGLTAMALNSFATYYPDESIPVQSLLNKDFYAMNCWKPEYQHLCNVVNTTNNASVHLNINQAFVQYSLDDTEFSLALGYSAFEKTLNGKTYASRVEAIDNRGANSIESFVNLTALYLTNFNQTVEQASLTSRILVFQSKIMVWTLQEDSVVSPNNANELKKSNSGINNLTFSNSNYKVCDEKVYPVNVDHLRGQIVGNLYASLFFLEKIFTSKAK